MSEVDVRLERVSKLFGDAAAVDDLSLDIEEGEFFSMLGPSGCGKTTTLRMIGGFEEPTYGTVFLGGRDVTDLPPYKRDVNTVFQSYALFPHLNVYDNVAFGLRRKKVAKDEIDRRVTEVMKLVDLKGFEQRKPPQMSGGQQQRVALARALVNHPKVLLLDEPLGALDLKLRKQMQLELKRIQQEVGITFIYVTHDQEEAMTMSDRLAVMRHGKIEQIGPPEAVYETPATEFVAGFLGRVEPARRHDAAGEQRADGHLTRCRRFGVRRDATHQRRRRPGREGRRAPREDHDRAGRGRAPLGHELHPGSLADVHLHRRELPVQGRGPRWGRADRVCPELGGGRGLPQPGQRVRLEWLPEHTFVVAPSVPLSEEEEVE